MEMTNINIRVEKTLKENAEELFSDLGLTMTTAVTAFLKSALRNDGIPFEMKRNSFNAETREAIAEHDEMRNEATYKRHESFSDLLKEVGDEA